MTNKEFTELLKKESETVLEILNSGKTEEGKVMFGNFSIAEHVSDNNYAKLTGLYNVMKKFPNLSNEQIEHFIRGKQAFRFLEKFIDLMPNALEQLKSRGSIEMSQTYSHCYMSKEVAKRKNRRGNIKKDDVFEVSFEDTI